MTDRASPRLQAKRSKRYTTRQCLRCDQPFKSEGNFNRLCQACKTSVEHGPSPAPVYHLTAPTRR